MMALERVDEMVREMEFVKEVVPKVGVSVYQVE